MSMRLSVITTFWVVVGLMVGVGQLTRVLLAHLIEINYYLAFSIALPSPVIFGVIILFLVSMIWLFYTKCQLGLSWAVALGLIVGGGISNFCDRLLLSGGVADYWRILDLSAINLPDIAIVIGIIWAIYLLTTSHGA